MTHQINDPGYGAQATKKGERIIRRDGTMNVVRKGARHKFADVYHVALNTSWMRFIIGAAVTFISVNLLFATTYFFLGMENVHGARLEGAWVRFEDAYFFSTHTLTTVGYGSLSPSSPLVSFIAGIEAMLGLLMFGVFTGLAFGRFSRVKPRIVYSDHVLLAPYRENMNGLMIRLANERGGALMDARVAMTLVVDHEEGGRMRRQFFDLTLEIAHVRSLALSWTVVHPITQDSPLYRLRKSGLDDANAEIIMVLHAFDDTIGQPFYSRISYKAEDLLVGHKFVPMFHDTHKGYVELDLSMLNETVEAELNDDFVKQELES